MQNSKKKICCKIYFVRKLKSVQKFSYQRYPSPYFFQNDFCWINRELLENLHFFWMFFPKIANYVGQMLVKFTFKYCTSATTSSAPAQSARGRTMVIMVHYRGEKKFPSFGDKNLNQRRRYYTARNISFSFFSYFQFHFHLIHFWSARKCVHKM